MNKSLKIALIVFSPMLLFVIFALFNGKGNENGKTSANINAVNTVSVAQVSTSTSAKPEIAKQIKIIGVGDMMFDRGVEATVLNHGRNPFANINFADLKPDLVVGNLEGPITDNPVCQNKPYSFKFASSTATMLKNAGINFVTLANNHSYDCFKKGLDDTRKALSEAGVGYFGGLTIGESYVVKEVDGKKFALIGIDTTVAPVKIPEVYDLVKKLKGTFTASSTSGDNGINTTPKVDYVLVFMHWGTEYEKEPNETQVKIAHTLINSGADAVFGHHPHVTQMEETYKGKTIFYSMGNYIFDQTTKDQKSGYLSELNINLDKDGKYIGQDYKIHPYTILGDIPQLD